MTLLYLPSAFSPASACLTKDCEPGSDSWVSRIAPFSTLSGKLMEPASWRRGWKKAPWMRHLSGPTLPPSTQLLGMAEWISSLPASRARTFPSLAGASASTASEAVSSLRSSGSPPIAVRDSCFWRTSQASLVPQLPSWTRPAPPTMPPSPREMAFRTWALKMVAYSSARRPASWENWPTSGGIRNGSLFQRPTWAPVTAARAGSASPGVWMTPNVPNGGRKLPESLVASKGMTEAGEKKSVGLESQSRYWLTPHGMSGMESATGRAGAGGEFAKQVTNWATPRATDGEKGGPNCRGGRGDPILAGQACQWPTPDAALHGGSNTSQVPAGSRPNISLAAKTWPTPAARDFKGHGAQGGATENGRQITDGSVGERGGLFAPGPSDGRWPGLIAAFPWLAPALESTFRGVVNGLAFDMGDSRAARLKCVGNGVVPLCAATAFVLLARRAGILKRLK